MGYLLQILLALGVLGLAEAGATTRWEAPWLVLALGALPHLLFLLARAAWRGGSFHASACLARAVVIAPVPCFAAAVALCGWPATAARWIGRPVTLLGWPEPAFLLVLAPFVVYQLLAIDAAARLADTRRGGRTSIRSLQVRMFLSGLVPLALYVGAASAVGASELLRAHVEEVALWNALFSALLLGAFAMLLPSILRNTWETAPLAEGAERRVLEAVARQAGFTCRELCVWRTGHLMANAAVVGLTRRDRVVLFSDSLLAILSLRELAAVFAHEMGHALRRHVTIFLVWALCFFLAADLLATHVVPQNEWALGAVVIGAFGLWYVAFGYLSRRFELDADLYSLELLGDPGALIAALEKVGGRLRDVASWRHFSTARRVDFIERAASDPDLGRRLRSRLRLATGLGAVLFVLCAALELLSMSAALDENLIHVDLRLGRYARAAERAEQDPDLDPELAALVRHARSLEGLDAAGLERAAREALRRGDLASALRSLELARLRGREDLREVGRALARLHEGEVAKARDLAAELPPEWRELLEPELEAHSSGRGHARSP